MKETERFTSYACKTHPKSRNPIILDSSVIIYIIEQLNVPLNVIIMWLLLLLLLLLGGASYINNIYIRGVNCSFCWNLEKRLKLG